MKLGLKSYRARGRLLDVATLVVAFPLSAAGYAKVAGRPWAPAVHVTVSALALVLAFMWVAKATLNRVYAPYHRSPPLFALRLVFTLALTVAAMLSLPRLETVGAEIWVLSIAVALAMVSVARLGWRVVTSGPDWIGERVRQGAPARAASSGRPPLAATPRRAEEPTPEAIRPSMDEVTYEAGSPNVLTMVKFVEGDHRAGRERAADPERARRPANGSFRREERGGEAALVLAGVLDVVTASEFRSLVDAVVSEQRRSIVLDLSGLRSIDSTGVSAIVRLVKRARAFGGVVRVEGVKDQPLEAFRLLRLDLVFELP